MAGSPSSHRKLVGHLAKSAGCHAIIIDYRLAPEHRFPKQIEDVVAAYEWLLHDKGISSNNIVFAGDSAGGNLTVSSSLAVRDAGLALPAAIVTFSPWIDMKLSGKGYQNNADKDVLVMLESMQSVVDMYVGDGSLDHPLVDLLHTDLKGLPPMYLTVGTAEVLDTESTMFAEKARSAGIEVQLELVEDMQHIWVCMAGNAPEADHTLSQATDFIRSKLGI